MSSKRKFEITQQLAQDTDVSCEMLSVMVYLLSKPDDWVIQVDDIKNRFGWGAGKARSTLARLRESGYVVTVITRDDNNRFNGKVDRLNLSPDKSDDIKDAITDEVKRLRAMPYREYLTTDHWKQIRKHAMKRARGACQVCNASGVMLDVHHRTYERRGSEHNSDVIVLCRDCHAKYHGKKVQA